MAQKSLVHNFAIKLAAPVKVIKSSNKNSRISRKCYAVVVKDGNDLKARITTSPVDENDVNVDSEFLLLPFTSNSLTLKGKRYVFSKIKDKYGHYICIIRESFTAMINYGTNTQYTALRPGVLISGHIVRKSGKMLFDYEQLIAFTEYGTHINEIKVDEDRPLFD